MFSGITYDVPSTGKKIHGLPSRKDQAFSIAWENAPSTLNHFQLKQIKNKEVTAKITTQSIIHSQQELKPQRQPYQLQQKDYERIFYENPNITQEELEKIMAQYDQYQRGVPSRSSKQESSGQGQRRVPIRPRQNMKDIIYNGVGVGQQAVRGGRVVGVICSVIILTSRLIVTIIIRGEADLHLYNNIHLNCQYCHLRHIINAFSQNKAVHLQMLTFGCVLYCLFRLLFDQQQSLFDWEERGDLQRDEDLFLNCLCFIQVFKLLFNCLSN